MKPPGILGICGFVTSRRLKGKHSWDSETYGCRGIPYSIDTSALLEGYVRRYPPDVVPRLWDEKLDQLIDAGRLIAAFDVLEELGKRDDDVHAWAKARERMFIEIASTRSN